VGRTRRRGNGRCLAAHGNIGGGTKIRLIKALFGGDSLYVYNPDPEGFDQNPTWQPEEIQLDDDRTLVLEST